jgi:hypothetical protein
LPGYPSYHEERSDAIEYKQNRFKLSFSTF